MDTIPKEWQKGHSLTDQISLKATPLKLDQAGASHLQGGFAPSSANLLHSGFKARNRKKTIKIHQPTLLDTSFAARDSGHGRPCTSHHLA